MFDFQKQKQYKHFLYLLPSFILLTVFTFYPLIKNIIISFNSNYNKFSDSFDKTIFFDLNNYRKIFDDSYFITSLKNTLLLVFISVPLSLIISLVIALCLNSVYNRYLKEFFKTIFLLPFLMNKVIMGIVFAFLFYHSSGLFQKSDGLMDIFLTKMFNLESGGWIDYSASYGRKMFVLIFYIIWTSLPLKVFIFILGLQNIDQTYYDAAKIDGASKFKIFYRITLPLLYPVFFYQFIVSFLNTFKEYESIIGLFGHTANNHHIQTITLYIFQQLQSSNLDAYAKGSAASVILFFISIIFSYLSFYFFQKDNND